MQEVVVFSKDNLQVRCPSSPKQCKHIRIVREEEDGTLTEMLYWDSEEWQEDPDLSCIGAIMGAITSISQGVNPWM